eukprot:CAMPEP_0117447530 /NCGR_PEP_ID=MMETSP0759-20121206/6925_1 /TAXON_ID=63605 /ORGANISM="Percolomonas cosmopolitus, Strain WS" /LENGTH=765 /DNA_ID=CAMNT_0005239873 /DNA_START=140 /DNA_END=2438 /DNA_ORIENTATION=+
MGNICTSKTLRYKQLLRNAFEHPNHYTGSLIQFSLSNPDSIPRLSRKLTKYVLVRFKRVAKKYSKGGERKGQLTLPNDANMRGVRVGIGIFRELVEATQEEYLLMKSLLKLLNTLLVEHEYVTLEEHDMLADLLWLLESLSGGQEMLTFTIRSQVKYLIRYTHDDASTQSKIRIAAMRVIARWNAEVRAQDLMLNIWDNRTEWTGNDILYQRNDLVRWNDHAISLNDIQGDLQDIHVAKAALHCIGQIAREMRIASIVKLIEPMMQFYDNFNAWSDESVSVTCLENVFNYGWTENGFVILSLLLPHIASIDDESVKIAAVQVATRVASLMNATATQGSNPLVTCSVLLDLLLSIHNGHHLYREKLLECLDAISQVRQRFCFNNFDIVTAIFGAMDRVQRPQDRIHLLDAMEVVTTVPSQVPLGRTYPQAILRQLFREMLAQAAEEDVTIHHLHVLQNIGKQSAFDNEESAHEPMMVEVIVDDAVQLHATQTSSAATASIIAATLSSKQEEQLHFNLVRLIEKLSVHTPQIYTELAKTYAIYLKSYQHRELPHSIPALFFLFDQMTENKEALTMINSLSSLYLVLVSLEYEDTDLEETVRSTISSQVEAKQVHPDFIATAELSTSTIEKLFTFTFNAEYTSDSTLLDRESISLNMSKIGRLSQHFENLGDALMRDYSELISPTHSKTLKKMSEWRVTALFEVQSTHNENDTITEGTDDLLPDPKNVDSFKDEDVEAALRALDSFDIISKQDVNTIVEPPSVFPLVD